MKRQFGLLLLILILQFVLVVPALANVNASSPTVTIDNEQIKLTVDPIIDGGSIIVQFRPIFEKLGLSIEWDGANQRIIGTKEGLVIELKIGSMIALINGKEAPLQRAPSIVNGVTLIPLRFIGEASGKDVNWNGKTQSVSIKDPGTVVNDTVEEPLKPAVNEQSDATPVNTTPVNTTPVKIPEDKGSSIKIINLTDLKSLITTNSKKSKNAFNDQEMSLFNRALAMDRTKLFEMLVSLYDYTDPDITMNKNIITFIEQYGMSELQELIDYSLSAPESEKIGKSINQILRAMPGADDANTLSLILEKHPIADVRYNAAYYISKFNTDAAFQVLTNAIAIEKNDSVLGNIVAAAIKVAGIDETRIVAVFNTYSNLSTAQQTQYTSMLLGVTYESDSMKAAWKSFLRTIVSDGTDQEKVNAQGILDYVFYGS